jgi:hypothetical protein
VWDEKKLLLSLLDLIAAFVLTLLATSALILLVLPAGVLLAAALSLLTTLGAVVLVVHCRLLCCADENGKLEPSFLEPLGNCLFD